MAVVGQTVAGGEADVDAAAEDVRFFVEDVRRDSAPVGGGPLDAEGLAGESLLDLEIQITGFILPGKTDSWLVFHAGRGYYARLLKAGVRIHERQGVILHSKTALIDDVWATVGSTNLDWRSFLHNHELNALVLGAEFGSQLKAMFERDLAASEAITLERWQRRSLDLRLKEMFARLWEYWL